MLPIWADFWKMMAQEKTDSIRRIPRTPRATQLVCSRRVRGLAKRSNGRTEIVLPQRKIQLHKAVPT
jgi:hypothetical protein